MEPIAILAILGQALLAFGTSVATSPAAIDLLVLLVIGPAVVSFMRGRGVEVDARFNQALHSALRNGLSAAAAKLDFSQFDTNDTAREALLDQAVDYVQKNNPDAVKHFKLDDNVDKLKELALPHIIDVLPFPFNVIGDIAGKVVGVKK